ncbi:hypothetical protein PGB90_009520 [Kerria lacca]
MIDIRRNPPKVLACLLSAADLTHTEVLSITFAVDKSSVSDYECPVCRKGVTIDTVIYHNKRSVVDWLVQHFYFVYDSKSGAILHRKPAYLTQSERHILNTILSKMDALNVYVTRRNVECVQILRSQPLSPPEIVSAITTPLSQQPETIQ